MLKYIGNGSLPGIPARDLSDREVEVYGGEESLLATGLYDKPQEKAKRSRKARQGGAENKAR